VAQCLGGSPGLSVDDADLVLRNCAFVVVVGGNQVQGLLIAAEASAEVLHEHRLGLARNWGVIEPCQGGLDEFWHAAGAWLRES